MDLDNRLNQNHYYLLPFWDSFFQSSKLWSINFAFSQNKVLQVLLIDRIWTQSVEIEIFELQISKHWDILTIETVKARSNTSKLA